MMLGMVLIPVGDAIAKVVLNSSPYSASIVAWIRFLIGSLFIIPFAVRAKGSEPLSQQFWGRQMLRGVLIVLTVVTIIKAVGLSPIADVFGAFFVGPILAVVLSAVLLGEKPNTLDWISVIVGFMGVLLVLQPAVLRETLAGLQHGFDSRIPADQDSDSAVLIAPANAASSIGVYWALLAGIFYGAFLTATRWAAASGPPLMQVAAQFSIAAVLLTPLGLYELLKYGLQEPTLLLVSGVTSVLANLFSIMALSRATPATLAPVVYMQVVSATFIGLLFFKDALSTMAAIGIAVIVMSGLFRIDFAALLSRRVK